MNKKLEQWIAEQEAIKAKRRDEHLIELGLIDEATSYEKITYYNVEGKALTGEEAKKIRGNGLKVVEKTEEHYGPIQVSDEEYELICKYAPENKITNTDDLSEKDYLKKIARSTKTVATILVFYVILSVVVGLTVGIILSIAN